LALASSHAATTNTTTGFSRAARRFFWSFLGARFIARCFQMRAWFEMNIAKALFDPEDWDEREVREVVESDWVRENGMGDSMNQEKFQKVRLHFFADACCDYVSVAYFSRAFGRFRSFCCR
jgi:hypothetical protein